MVFGNSSGKAWALVQRAVAAAGLVIEPEHIVIPNKGQRPVNGLASGFEHAATLDLVLTMTPADDETESTFHPSKEDIAAVTTTLADTEFPTPSHLYLELLRHSLRHNWSVADLDLRTATQALVNDGWTIDSKTGHLTKP